MSLLQFVDGLQIHNDIIEFNSFESWADNFEASVRPGYVSLFTLDTSYGFIEVVKATSLEDAHDSYGEIPQGTIRETEIVFRVNGRTLGEAARYFSKSGTSDSYAVVTWDGTFYEVTATPITVQEFKRIGSV